MAFAGGGIDGRYGGGGAGICFRRRSDDADISVCDCRRRRLQGLVDQRSYGEDITVTIHVWSQDSDREEMKTLQQQIYDVLHDQDLTVTGFNVAALLFLSSETVFDEDKDALHGISRFRCLISA